MSSNRYSSPSRTAYGDQLPSPRRPRADSFTPSSPRRSRADSYTNSAAGSRNASPARYHQPTRAVDRPRPKSFYQEEQGRALPPIPTPSRRPISYYQQGPEQRTSLISLVDEYATALKRDPAPGSRPSLDSRASRPTSYHHPQSPGSRPTSYYAHSFKATPQYSHSPQSSVGSSKPLLPFTDNRRGSELDFDPKKVTNAILHPPERRPVASAPYISLNLPATERKIRTVTIPTTIGKRRLRFARWIGIIIRLLQLLLALGLTVAYCLVSGYTKTEQLLCRVSAGIAILHSVYSIYHLKTSSTVVNSQSAKMYHLFALTMDMGLAAFLALASVYVMRARNSGSWKTTELLKQYNKETLLSLWIGVLTLCGLIGVTMFLEVWFIYAFRILSRLPPDMDPWEKVPEDEQKDEEKDEKNPKHYD
jgi:hypothetical protein